MKKLMTTLSGTAFACLFLISCGSSPSPEEKALIEKAKQDSIARVETAKQDSINAIMPEINVNIYARTDVFYDSEGWPVEMGKVSLVKDFQNKKEHQLNGNEYIEKIEIVGQSEEMTLQFINGKSNKMLHEEKAISLNGSKTFTTTDPAGEKQKHYQEWLTGNGEALVIKVLYKDKTVFEGKINPSKS
jgi:PBP1b-binding outer membrane lipoprotein LpoB